MHFFNFKIRVAIAAIGKMENHYIKEWVEHYLNLGVDKIFLYDNNDIDGEKFEDEISKYIKKGFVEIINYRGKKSIKNNLQSLSYLDCYKNRLQHFDYLGIFDIDEFLDLGNNFKIASYLTQSKFNNCQCIRFPWLMMDDNDFITIQNNNYSLKTRFTRGQFLTFCNSILKTGIKEINSTKVLNGHGPVGLVSCDPNGFICNNGLNKSLSHCRIFQNPKPTKEFVRHYSCKTLQEFVEIKMNRLYPDQNEIASKKKINLNYFFLYNKITKAKLSYLKNKGLSFNTSQTKNEINKIKNK